MVDLYQVGRVPIAELVPAAPLTPALSPGYRGEGVDTSLRSARSILPPRFQRVRARGWKMPAGGKCCSRPGRWGNPFEFDGACETFAWLAHQAIYALHTSQQTIGDALEHALLFRGFTLVRLHRPCRWRLISTAAEFFDGVQSLAGRPLGCFCALDEPCHVDALLVVANELALRRAGHDPAELLRVLAGRTGGKPR